MKKSLILTLLGATALSACGQEASAPAQPAAEAEEQSAQTPAAAPSQDAIAAETERLNQWFSERWEEELDFSPIFKTFLGNKDNYDEIDDFSEASAQAQLDWRRAATAELTETIDYDLLTPEAKISYDIWLYQLAEEEAARPFWRRGYVFHQMNGPHAFLPNFLINFHAVDTGDDMRAYITRVSGVSRALGQALENAKLAASEGVHAPRFAYEGVKQQSQALITGAPFDEEGESPLWGDANRKIGALVGAGEIEAAEADEMRDALRDALINDFKPAYDALIAWVDEDIENSPEIATGVGALPDGAAYYKERLAASTTTDMTADEVHELGLSEVARIRSEMEAIKETVGFEGTLQEFFTFVREDDQFYYPNTDEGRVAYLKAARDHLAFIDTKLSEFFGLLPKAGLVVKRVEAFRERDGGAQHYYPGTPDGSRPGIFYAHLSDMKSMPIPQLEVIAYHEGNPGHHMQNTIAQEVEGLPEFRNQANFTAYGEGWGLYSELLAKEMGAYQDPYSDFGRLTTEIWRAIRLVVDTGLHAKGWTEQEAIDYFVSNSPAAEGQIKSEVQRYIVMPGQATAYKVGMLKIQELRAMAEYELGDGFDIREFHDVILGGGAMPLAVLERRVNEWVAAEKAA